MSAPVRQRPRTAALLTLARAHQPRYLKELAELVAIDSGSYSPAGVNRVGEIVGDRLRNLGFDTRRLSPPPVGARATGDLVVARKKGSLSVEDGGRRILLAAHMDTVFEDGTAAERPFALAGSHAHGPGVSDDKGGLVAGLTALRILEETGFQEYAELVFLAVPDEEIGSPASRPLTEKAAHGMHYALALECARENGDIVIARKGVADFRLTVTGRAAHAGIEPERGANAALAAAHLTVALQGLNSHWDDVTVNVGMVHAGTRINIVCPEAELHVEVRSATTRGIRQARQAIEELAAHPAVAGTTVRVEQLDLCPPMEDTDASRRLLRTAQSIGAEMGLSIGAAATGGVGDANLIAGAGVPVLDGLGPVGGGDHSPQEWLDTTTVAPRVALLASLIAELGREQPRRPDPAA
ncbi:M20 family metallopeptidase [Streptomyces sp. WI03-4A]|uniref:M20 family metallopeptidase n=1 Tax=Streptomyces sp. WI03-4A TaxID=3028706 RepID=UPI0029AFC876|nr:M20 family metallopeptidase [Streptomyces sp. WI03-4A]MDX2592043.1 M20 family metallopeptidase [Streptomyces sp. WI03-4A]